MWCGCGGTNRTWSCEAELVDELVGAVDLAVALGAARPADDQQQRVGPAELGERPDRHVGTLQRLDAPDEQQHRPSIGRSSAARAPDLLAGREEGVLDAGRDDLDPALRDRRRGAGTGCSSSVQLTQIASAQLMISASARSRQLGSGSPPSALTRASVWNVDDERDVEVVLDAVGDDAAQPVVGVHDVGAAVGRRCGRARRR